MRYVVDVETTTINKGNPFTKANKLVCVGLKPEESFPFGSCYIFYEQDFDTVAKLLSSATELIGCNIKFDLHWLQRYGLLNLQNSSIRVWDLQLADFVYSAQRNPYPSLNGMAASYGLGSKLDIIASEYWDKGIDTDRIPKEVLTEYLTQDLVLTEAVYLKQREELASKHTTKKALLSLMNQDLIVLQQMEYNGMKYDSDKSRAKARELEHELDEIHGELKGRFNVQHPVNWNSHEELSAMLYGGTIICERTVQVGIFKTGKRVGQAKFKKVGYPIEYPRLVEPLDGTELKKDGYWKTDLATLDKLKFSKATDRLKILLRRRSEIEKLKGTYLEALPALIESMNWADDFIHGQFNQCVAITGRLSSSKPNLQNPSSDAKEFFITRYAHD